MPSLTTTQSAQACANRRRPTDANVEQQQDKPSRTSQARGFGLLVLLLAAMPYDENGRDGALDTGDGYSSARPSLASTANLRFCASMEDVMRAGRRAMEFDFDNDMMDDDDDADANLDESEAERRRRRKRKQAGKKAASKRLSPSVTPVLADPDTITSEEDADDSSQGHTEELSTASFASVPTTSTTTGEDATSFISGLSADCLSFAMGYLPLKDLSQCRTVNKAFGAAASADTPASAAIGCPGSVFMRFDETNRGGNFAVAPNRNVLKWACSFCNTENSVTYSQCRTCQGGNGDCTGVRKIFMGQLRKERTTELVEWILARIYPEMTPLHIENHTSKDNRGKGCAWIYVTSQADEAKILSLNKRMFVDVDNNGKEGVWFCDDARVNNLNNLATERAFKQKRPQVLPRQPLTAEKPGSKLQASRGNNTPVSYTSSSASGSSFSANLNTAASAQELYEQLSAPKSATRAASVTTNPAARPTAGFPTHTNAATPVPRSKQQKNMNNAVKTQWDAPHNQNGGYSNYQYQPNSINVFDYSAPIATPAPQTQTQTPSSLGHSPSNSLMAETGSTSAGSSSGSWTHNPYAANVLVHENLHPQYHHYPQQHGNYYSYPEYDASSAYYYDAANNGAVQ